ncbi:MerR family transcriptional regulator [Brevibacterium atlanticum]|uniref:MerR family transcriptional regulator n=1 Tax=Brevibacterium atlanticum TaxID=2697563 RepID=UPI001AA1D03D|nr:MerR family transcriptional regulator [Brevibacterium atlanticum]
MRIGEVARRSGVSARMLRHYESIGLLEPSDRTSAGYREYSDTDIGRIFHIEGLRRLGMSLTEVGEVLADPSFDTTRLLGDLIAETRERIAAEERLLAHLERIERLGRTDAEALLWTVDLMRSLESSDVIQRHKAALGGGIDGSVPIEALSSAVLDEPAPNAAGAMRWALAQAGSAAVAPLLTGVDDPSAAVRVRAIRALDEIRRTTAREDLGEDAVEVIREALRSRLNDEDAEVRGLCAFGLTGLDDAAAVPELLTIAMNGPRDIDAAEALAGFVSAGSTASGDIMAALDRAARSPRADERFRALQVLIEIADERVDRDRVGRDRIGRDQSGRGLGSRDSAKSHREQAAELLARLAEDDDRQVAVTATAELRRRSGRLGEGNSGSPHSGA